MQNSVNLSEMTETEIQVQKPTEIETEFTTVSQNQKRENERESTKEEEFWKNGNRGPKKGNGAVKGSERRQGWGDPFGGLRRHFRDTPRLIPPA